MTYTYGLDLISRRDDTSTSYYHYDGQMSVRHLSPEVPDPATPPTIAAIGARRSTCF